MRYVPPALADHLTEEVTTTCRLFRLVLRNGDVYGMCSLDRDVVFNGVTYKSMLGFDSSVIATDDSLGVSNGDITSLLAEYTGGITYEMALAGELDDSRWELLLVNYNDLSQGAMVIDAGDIGEVKITDGIVYAPEMLSYAMRLKQSVGTSWSRRCRAVFGTPNDSQSGCGVDTTGMWLAGTVTQVDPEDAHRIFADIALIGGELFYPGRVRWTTGKNASSRLAQVEAMSTTSGTVVLMEPTGFAVEVGDAFEIRKDCNKSPSNCLAFDNFVNYKGEPYIPVGDGLETQVPSAQVFGGLSGSEIVD